MHGILPEVVEITTYYKQQLRNNIILWRDLFRNALHSNVMLRFMVQAFQDPPLCSSTYKTKFNTHVGLFLFIPSSHPPLSLSAVMMLQCRFRQIRQMRPADAFIPRALVLSPVAIGKNVTLLQRMREWERKRTGAILHNISLYMMWGTPKSL